MYEDFAATYDLFDDEDIDGAVDLILSQQIVSPARVLDFGGGTGRIAMELIDRNVPVDCYEPSPAMRSVILSRLHLHRGSLSRLRLIGEEGGLENLLAGSLIHSRNVFLLLDEATARRTLTLMRRILCAGGRLILNFPNSECAAPVEPAPTRNVTVGDALWSLRSTKTKIDREHMTVRWALDMLGHSKKTSREDFQVKLYSLDQFTALLDGTGFSLVAAFADYDRKPFDAKRSPSCVLIAACADSGGT